MASGVEEAAFLFAEEAMRQWDEWRAEKDKEEADGAAQILTTDIARARRSRRKSRSRRRHAQAHRVRKSKGRK